MPLVDTPEWKGYQARLTGAYAIDVRWTNGPLDPKHETKDNTRRFRLATMKPDYILLEKTGSHRTVWNGSSGIDEDLIARTYRRLTVRPVFEPASWLGLPLVPLDSELKSLPFLSVLDKAPGKTWPSLQWRGWPGSANGGPGVLIGPEVINYWFDPVRKLIVWREDQRILTRSRVTLFDLTPLLVRGDFAIDPPQGFTEQK